MHKREGPLPCPIFTGQCFHDRVFRPLIDRFHAEALERAFALENVIVVYRGFGHVAVLRI
jgi:hypothetical protein